MILDMYPSTGLGQTQNGPREYLIKAAANSAGIGSSWSGAFQRNPSYAPLRPKFLKLQTKDQMSCTRQAERAAGAYGEMQQEKDGERNSMNLTDPGAEIFMGTFVCNHILFPNQNPSCSKQKPI